jgi:DNA-directed RNA polymerase subunit RPC12/RpoP
MSQKYRHRGYRESEREDDRERERRDRREPPPRAISPEQRAQIRSLRKATDREAQEVVRCPTCGRNVENTGRFTRETRCPGCSADLRCCRTCAHFDSGARWECRAPIEARVENKTKANDCARFEPRLQLDATGRRSSERGGPVDPRTAFENLFKR